MTRRLMFDSSLNETQKPIVVSRDPLETEVLWTTMYRALDWHGRRGVTVHSMAGVDMALWDIKGQKLGVPVWKLLRGRYRNKVVPYASLTSLSFKPFKLTERATACRNQGFNAVKFD